MKRPFNLTNGILFVILLGVIIFPFVSRSGYWTHIMILIFIWSGIATAWSYVGRFGLVSLCHGAFVGIAAYTTALLFNLCNLTPWIGMLAGLTTVGIVAGVLGYACFRFGVTGHYFAITTLVITEVVALLIIALRDTLQTGGRLGLTINPMGTAPLYFQFESKTYFYFISLAVLLFAMYLWKRVDKSKARTALMAIGDNEVAASSVGISVVRYKTAIFILSSLVAGICGVVYGQYMMYLNTATTAGATASLAIVFKVILGGMFTLWGPMIGTVLITSLEEYVRVVYGTAYVGWSMVGYAILIIILIIFLPKGVYGTLREIVDTGRIKKL
jgi:branched-chain amino acid transport system permease protein